MPSERGLSGTYTREQVLDQILVSPRLFKNFESSDSVHVNAEFDDQDSDHDRQVTRFRFGQGIEDEQ